MSGEAATLARMLEATKPVPFDRLSVSPVTVRVTEGDRELVARLLDPRPITAAEFAEIERRNS